MSGFSTLELGLRSLRAQVMVSGVIAHNIANSRSPGYSRQVADLRPPPSLRLSALGRTLSLGTGVFVSGVRRQREEFLDRLCRLHLADHQRWETQRHTMDLVELAFAEPVGFGPRQACLRLWDAFQELAAEPESGPVRAAVREEAASLASNLAGLARQLGALRADRLATAEACVQEINHLARQIAALNRDLRLAALHGTQANDLEDRRDLLLDRLAALAAADSAPAGDGTTTVSINGVVLVAGDTVAELRVDVGGGTLSILDPHGAPVEPPSGELAALRELHDSVLPSHQALLDGFARRLADALNSVHRAGYGLDGSSGLDLFRYDEPSPALTLRLAPEVAADPTRLAASSGGAEGDGLQALAMARVLTSPNFDGMGASEFWAAAIGKLGLEVEQTARRLENTALLAEQAQMQRARVSGVNLDEETVELVRCQHAYAAAARLISVADEMLEQLLNRTGRVGR